MVLAGLRSKLAHNFLSLTSKKTERLSYRSAIAVVIYLPKMIQSGVRGGGGVDGLFRLITSQNKGS